MNKEVKLLLGIKDSNIIIVSVKEERINNHVNKVVEIKSNKNKYRCPLCNTYTNSVHDRLKPIRSKCLNVNGYRFILIMNKRRFICHKCNKKFTEEIGFNEKNKTISNTVRQKIRKDLLNASLNIKTIAELNNVSDYIVRKELLNAMKNYSSYLTRLPSIISFDEFKADTNYGKYAFVINDLLHRKTLDILPNRRKDYLINYFNKVENRESVKFVVCDMYEPYLIVQKTMFSNAKFVVDRFHYVKYIMKALDNIRIRKQKDFGYNSKEYRLLKNKKNTNLLRKHGIDIEWFIYTKRYKHGHIIEMLPGDILKEILNIDEEIKRGYQLKELFLDIVKHSTYEESNRELEAWIDLCLESKIEEFVQAAKTIYNWKEYICNSFIDKRLTNGFTEGRNNKIKVIKRIAYGYRNFEFFRLRLMYIFNNKLK